MKSVLALTLVVCVLLALTLQEFFGVGLSTIGAIALAGGWLWAVMWCRRLERNEKPLPPPPASLTRQVRKR
jgi:hypothetical protein